MYVYIIFWQFYTTCLNIIFVGIRLGWTFKTLNLLGWIPTVAPLRSSTSPPPPLAYFKHIKLSVPKRKIWYTLNNHLQLHFNFNFFICTIIFQRKVNFFSRPLQKKFRLNSWVHFVKIDKWKFFENKCSLIIALFECHSWKSTKL